MRVKLFFNCKWLFWTDGLVIYPFIFFRQLAPSKKLILHELVHIEQIKKNGWIKFYFKYFLDYLKNRSLGMNHYNAYFNIPFEIEARAISENKDRQ